MSSYFRQKGLSQSNDAPVFDDLFNRLFPYSYWQRCVEFLDVIHLVFSGAVHSRYCVDFVD